MFHVKGHKTIDMFDNFSYLGVKRRKLLGNTWAQLFRDEILRHLPVHLLKEHYVAHHGRPTNELFAMLGTMILQQMHDLTDEKAVEQFCFNIQWGITHSISQTQRTQHPSLCAQYLGDAPHHDREQPLPAAV
ncbi:MAG: transposase [Desulfocapsaceae bacterium]|nr:transposase [Desulfocapsaceae bacterium]